MKKIDYTERAYFEEFMSEDNFFIKKIIKKYQINSALEIPCANGRNLDVIANSVKYAYFADINLNMLRIIDQKIYKMKYSNCKAMKLDMKDLSNFLFSVDAIFIMQQAFQMLSYEDALIALTNFRKTNCKYIIIDFYDFKCGCTDWPKFLTSTTHFIDSENRLWERSSLIKNIDERIITIIHNYKASSNLFYAEVQLTNFSRNEIIDECVKRGFIVSKIYTTYNCEINLNHGRTIIILYNNKESFI